MRILHVIDACGLGGAFSQLCAAHNGAHSHGLESRAAILTRVEPKLCSGFDPTEVLECGRRHRLDPFALERLRRAVRGFAPHVIHAWDQDSAAFAARAAEQTPCVVSLRGARRWPSLARRIAWRKVFRQGAKFVANSSAVRDAWLREGAPAQRTCVVTDGVAPATSDPTDFRAYRQSLLAELGLAPESRLIGLVARLAPQSGVKELIWAADLMHVLHEDVCVLIVGDGPERPALQRFARLAAPPGAVRFVGARADAARLLRLCNVVWCGGTPLAPPSGALMAMEAGTPVVADRSPGVQAAIEEGQSGLLANPADRAARVKATIRLLEDPDLTRRLAARGQEVVREQFSLARMTQQLEEVYREVAAERERAFP